MKLIVITGPTASGKTALLTTRKHAPVNPNKAKISVSKIRDSINTNNKAIIINPISAARIQRKNRTRENLSATCPA